MPLSLPEARLRARAESLLAEAGAPGVTVALAIDGRPALNAGFGSRDLVGAAPIEADASFLVYSVTKTLLAAASMRLVDYMSLALDAPVVELLPGVDVDSRATLRMLLNHTSGLPDYGGMPAYQEAVRASPAVPWSEEEFLKRTLALGQRFAPSHGWAYSNIGYMLVRWIVTRHGGGSLQTALDDLLFRPLGLRHTRVASSLADTDDLTPGFTTAIGNGEPVDIRGRYHPGWVSHGVVRSPASELAVLIDALFTGRLVSMASLAAMRDAVPVDVRHPVIRQPGYGLGLMADRDPTAGGLAGHAGGGPGYASAAFSLDDARGRRITSVALVNRDGGEAATSIAVALAREVAESG